jgi:hypothetical protein
MELDRALHASSIATVLPVTDLAAASRVYERLLGVGPTFVDGARWVQFDVAGGRLCLAGEDRAIDRAGLMIKVLDLEAARKAAQALGLIVSAIESGPHERRFIVTGPNAWPLIYYVKAGT